MKYGINESRKLVCRTHQQAYPTTESCPWCEPPKPAVPCDPAADQECYQCGGSGFYYAGIGVYRCHCVHGVGSP